MSSARVRRALFERDGFSTTAVWRHLAIAVLLMLPSVRVNSLGLCIIAPFAAQTPMPHDCCVCSAIVVAFDDAPFAANQALPFTDLRFDHHVEA
ncbi:MAG: hypothetical protein ACLQIQ_21470 [Beijerinckiaceae bacterium]